MLSGKKVLVTGAAGALGQTMVSVMKQNGALVFGTFRRLGSASVAQKPDVSLACDLTDEASVVTCFDEMRSAAGDPDILIHCAGGFASDGRLSVTSMETWERMIGNNLTGTFLVLREGIRRMDSREYGRIILVSALSALTTGPGAVAYRVSKAGVRTLLETAEAEKKGNGLTINALAPSTIDTPQNRADMPDADHTTWVPPHHLADAVVFLCSEAAGSISGSVIPFP